MLRHFTLGSLFLGAAALAGAGLQPVSAAIIPANEAWTEATSGFVPGASWGNYTTGQSEIVLDKTDKTAGTGSIKYVGIYHGGQYTMQPAITFYTPSGRPDMSAYAGGTVSFDFKFDGPDDYQFMWIYLNSKTYDPTSGDGVSVNMGSRQLTEAVNLKPGQWNHIVAALPADWASASDPTSVYRIMFAIGFKDGSGYDSTPRNIWFDNLEFTSVPEPSAGALFLLGGLPVLLRRR